MSAEWSRAHKAKMQPPKLEALNGMIKELMIEERAKLELDHASDARAKRAIKSIDRRIAQLASVYYTTKVAFDSLRRYKHDVRYFRQFYIPVDSPLMLELMALYSPEDDIDDYLSPPYGEILTDGECIPPVFAAYGLVDPGDASDVDFSLGARTVVDRSANSAGWNAALGVYRAAVTEGRPVMPDDVIRAHNAALAQKQAEIIAMRTGQRDPLFYRRVID